MKQITISETTDIIIIPTRKNWLRFMLREKWAVGWEELENRGFQFYTNPKLPPKEVTFNNILYTPILLKNQSYADRFIEMQIQDLKNIANQDGDAIVFIESKLNTYK